MVEEKPFELNSVTFFKRLLKKGIPLHPTIVLEQIAKYRKQECGRTLLHFAMKRAARQRKVHDAKEIEILLHLGYPMYEATTDGDSILYDVLSPKTDLAISDKLL